MSAAEMRHRAMDCWNRDDQKWFGPFCASQNRKAGLCREEDRRRPRKDRKEDMTGVKSNRSTMCI